MDVSGMLGRVVSYAEFHTHDVACGFSHHLLPGIGLRLELAGQVATEARLMPCPVRQRMERHGVVRVWRDEALRVRQANPVCLGRVVGLAGAMHDDGAGGW